MPRPSQCPSCFMFESCFNPGSPLCAEDQENRAIARRKFKPVSKPKKEKPVSKQLYSTPDGSVWENLGSQGDGDMFNRVGSSDDGHENDFRAHTLDEVLTSWGALSLHDPIKSQVNTLAAALAGMTYDVDVMVFSPRIIAELDRMGYEIKRKKED